MVEANTRSKVRLTEHQKFLLDHMRVCREQVQTLRQYAKAHGLSVSGLYAVHSTLDCRGIQCERGHRIRCSCECASRLGLRRFVCIRSTASSPRCPPRLRARPEPPTVLECASRLPCFVRPTRVSKCGRASSRSISWIPVLRLDERTQRWWCWRVCAPFLAIACF